MPRRHNTELGQLQLAVMNILWTREHDTVHEVLGDFPANPKKPAYTTISTVLRNLEKRGLVTHEVAEGTRMFRYRPTVSARDTRLSILHDILKRLFDGSPVLLVSQLLETTKLSPEELAEI